MERIVCNCLNSFNRDPAPKTEAEPREREIQGKSNLPKLLIRVEPEKSIHPRLPTDNIHATSMPAGPSDHTM